MDYEFILNFIIGGLIVASLSYLLKHTNGKIPIILWSLPYTLFPILFMMWYKKYSNKTIAKVGLNSSHSIIILFFFLYSFYIALLYFERYGNGMFYALSIAFIVWSIVVMVYYLFF